MAALTLASTLALSACGGGGSGGSSGSSSNASSDSSQNSPVPSTLTGITEVNHVNVSANGYVGARSLVDAPAQGTELITGVAVGDAAFSLPRSAIELLTLGIEGSARIVSGVSQNVVCPGGGNAQFDATMANSSQLSAGDVIAVAFSDCVSSGTKINGKMSIAVQENSGPLSGSVLSTKLAVRYEGFSVVLDAGSRNIDGDMQLAFARDASGKMSYAISGNILSIAETDKDAPVVQRTLSSYSATISSIGTVSTSTLEARLSGQTNAAGQFSVNLKTLQPLVDDGSTGYPKSGVMLISGAGSTVTLTALDAQKLQLDYSAKGDGVVTKSSTLAWVDLKKAI